MTKGKKVSILIFALTMALFQSCHDYNLNKNKSENIINQPIISIDFDDIFTPSDNNMSKTK